MPKSFWSGGAKVTHILLTFYEHFSDKVTAGNCTFPLRHFENFPMRPTFRTSSVIKLHFECSFCSVTFNPGDVRDYAKYSAYFLNVPSRFNTFAYKVLVLQYNF